MSGFLLWLGCALFANPARGVESAYASYFASISNYDDVLVTLTAEEARVYVLIRTLEERIELAQANVQIQERSLQIAEVRFRNDLDAYGMLLVVIGCALFAYEWWTTRTPPHSK